METLTFDQLHNAVAMLTKEVRELKRMLIEKQEQAPTEQPEQLLTIEEAAKFLRLAVPTIYSKVSRGELPVMKQGKRLYFSRTELMEYVKAGRKKSNAETLAKLAKDEDSEVRRSAARNPKTPAEVLSELANDRDWHVRINAARNPNTSAETLSELAKDKVSEVRRSAASNPNTPAETLAELANDEDWYVRRYAAKNPNTPKKQ